MDQTIDREEALQWVLEKISAAKKKAVEAPPSLKTDKKKDLTEKKVHEVKLWEAWKKGGEKPKDLDPLLKSFAPLIQQRVNTFRRAEVPTSAIAHEHKKRFVEALRTWDPKKGALNTWISWKMKRAGRYVDQNKNFARISENISQHIGSYNAVKAELSEKLGHEPDAHAIHDYVLKTDHPRLSALSLKDIQRLEKEQRRGLIQTGHDVEELGGAPLMSSRAEEVKHLIIPQLTDQERKVHELTFGLNGQKQLKPGEIAKKLKMDNSKVAKLRTSIWNKMKPYLGDES
jgi:DNA-directed RNA polymerase specialized sigma subunit